MPRFARARIGICFKIGAEGKIWSRSPGERMFSVSYQHDLGNFRAAGIFFRYQIPCMNFFRP